MSRWTMLALTILAVSSRAIAAPPPPENISLPYVLHDELNSNWDIQTDGSIGDGGNNLYDGGGHLFIGNQPFQPAPGVPTYDAARNEVSIPTMAVGGLNVSRHVQVNPHENWCRYTEIFENPGGAPVKAQMRVNFSIGTPPTMVTPYLDVKHKSRQLGVSIGNQTNFVSFVAAGPGSKIEPRLEFGVNQKEVNLFYDFEVPPRQVIAIVHIEVRRAAFDQCVQSVSSTKDKQYLKDLDPAVARKVMNFSRGAKFIGDEEILRGDTQDVIELRGGDQYKGTIKLDRFKLNTFYGPMDLAGDRVIGMINVGKFKPRQLVITADGEVFGGDLQSPTIQLQMSTGQTTDVPLSQIARIGYHKREGEPEEWTFTKPAVILRGGDRVFINPPPEPFNVLTRYGWLKIKSDCVSALLFQSDEHAVYELRLTDGSHFTGLLDAPTLSFTLADSQTAQVVKFPIGDLLRLDLAQTPDSDEQDPSLTLANDDVLVGSLSGQLKLQTAFDTLTIDAAQIASMQHGEGASLDVEIGLWDNTLLSGQLASPDVTCSLKCGVPLTVPIALVQNYLQPNPQPSAAMIDKIKTIVADLSADDWKIRDRAQSTLVALGPIISSVIRKEKPSQPPEAQQRLDAILAKFQKDKAGVGPQVAPPQELNKE